MGREFLGLNGRILPALALGVSLLSVSAASAQSDEAKADAPIVNMSPEASPAPPAPPAPKDYGPPPEATPWPTDPKLAKSKKKDRREDYPICFGATTRLDGGNENGLKACDRLLSNTLGEDDPRDRRAATLQRRAAYLVALKDYDQALADLDAADAIGKAGNDPLFDSGLGIGNGMLRAVALGRTEKLDAANAELDRVAAIRPHASATVGAIDRIRYHFAKDIDAMLARNAAKLRWQPDVMRMLVPLYIWRGDLESASKYADEVSLIDPKPQSGWTMSGTGGLGGDVQKQVELDLQRAYIWSGLGQGEKGEGLIAGARAEITEFVGSPPVAEKGQKISKSKQRDYDARKAKGEQLENLVVRWEKAIALRADALVKPAEELTDTDSTAMSVGTVAGIDIMRKLKFKGAEEGAAVTKLIKDLDAAIANDIFKIDNADLSRMLPEAEYLRDVPNFGWGGSQWLFGNGNGHSQAREKGSDISTVRFGTTSGSGPTAEELALLAAAQFTEKEGKDSFILLARRAIKRTTTVYGYGNYTYDSGYESQLRLVMLDSANIPAEWQAKKARLITVKEVRDTLKPRYDALEARKAAAKAAKK
jgi:tetratricopeptide (TPR) repeat protein